MDDFEEHNSPEPASARRPLGYWLRLVDRLISREFAAAFEGEDATRRDWMLLNALSGAVDAPGLSERLARKGGKRLRRLESLGWAEERGDGTWVLTDAGREARERLGEAVGGIRSRVAGAVSPDDYATTVASLEAIARELGWDETQPFPRGSGRGRFGGFGPGRFGGPGAFGGPGPFHPGWGPNLHHGFDPRAGRHAAWSEDGCHGRGHDHPHERGHGRRGRGHGFDGGHGHGIDGGRKAEEAYERGFAAGFAAQSGSRSGQPAPDAA